MTVPASLVRSTEATLESHFGKGLRIRNTAPLGGGCINPAAKLEAGDGSTYFLKWNPNAPQSMFGAEADGLTALAAPGALRIPAVLGRGGEGTPSDPGWLLLEFIPQGRPGHDYGERLGRGLAQIHGSALQSPDSTSGITFGWHQDNFIGSLPQENSPSDDWVTFWRERRLEPQIRMARDRGHFTGRGGEVLDALLSRIEEVMAGTALEVPALIHGDLWSGNFYPGPSGEPVLIDPAVYRGVSEVDLAMMELFGSLPRGFREGYESMERISPEYEAFRRDLYQLYYLLVHVNLFGGSYESGSIAAAQKAMRGA